MDTRLTDEQRRNVEEFRARHHTGVLTLLFTDMVGSTELKRELGDAPGAGLVDEHHRVVRELLKEFPEAQEIKTAGDSFFIVFIRPSDAVRFSLTLHARLREASARMQRPLRVRVGIHMGEVFVQREADQRGVRDILGLQVDLAARVAALGLDAGNQTLMTRPIFDNARIVLRGEELPGLRRLMWVSHGPYILKGIEEPLTICEAGEEEFAPLEVPPDSEKARRVGHDDEIGGWRPALGVTLPATNWVLESRLGTGGFGEVWLAHDRGAPARKTVFKFCTRRSKVRSLRRELDVFNRLVGRSGRTPPGIVEVHGAHDAEPPYYIELEYVSGGDLRAWIEREGKSAPLHIKLDLALQMAKAVSVVHEAGFVHRDIKPANFLVEPAEDESRAPTLHITDFGIGQAALDDVLGEARQTALHSGTLAIAAGTFLYVAPELLAHSSGSSPGHVAKQAETSSDIYGLGVSLYQLFAGDCDAIPGPGLRAVDDPILREDLSLCVDEDPRRRPSAKALMEKLATHDERSEALRRSEYSRLHRERRRAQLIALGATVSLLLIASLALAAWHQRGLLASRLRQTEAGRLALEARQRMATGSYEAVRLAQRAVTLDDNEDTRAALTDTIRHTRLAATLAASTASGHLAQFTSDGKHILTSGSDSTVRMWNLSASVEAQQTVSGAERVFAQFAPDQSRVLLVASDAGDASLWLPQDAQMVSLWRDHEASSVKAAVWLPQSARALVVSDDLDPRSAALTLAMGVFTGGALLAADDLVSDSTARSLTLRLFNASGEAIGSTPLSSSVEFAENTPDMPLPLPLAAAAECTLLAIGDNVILCDGAGNLIKELPRQPLGFNERQRANDSLVLSSSDSSLIASSTDGQSLHLWSSEGTLIHLIEKYYTDQQFSMAGFNAQGTQILSIAEDLARLWSPSAQMQSVLRGHAEDISCFAFSPDGRFVATGSLDRTVKLWSTDGQLVATLRGHIGAVEGIRFSPDGALLMSRSADLTARLWDLNGNLRAVLSPHFESITHAEFSPDTHFVLTSSRDGLSRLFYARDDDVLAAAARAPQADTDSQNLSAERLEQVQRELIDRFELLIQNLRIGEALEELLARANPDSPTHVPAMRDRRFFGPILRSVRTPLDEAEYQLVQIPDLSPAVARMRAEILAHPGEPQMKALFAAALLTESYLHYARRTTSGAPADEMKLAVDCAREGFAMCIDLLGTEWRREGLLLFTHWQTLFTNVRRVLEGWEDPQLLGAAYEMAIDAYQKARDRSGDPAAQRSEFLSVISRAGRFYASRGDTGKALEMYHLFTEVAGEGLAAPATDEQRLTAVNEAAWSQYLWGKAFADAGSEEQARRLWSSAEQSMRADMVSGEFQRHSVQVGDTYVKLLLSLGENERAAPLVQDLIARGWADGEFLTMTGASEEGESQIWTSWTQYPRELTVSAGVSSELIFGRLAISGATEGRGPEVPGVVAELGWGTDAQDPATEWTWKRAEFNAEAMNPETEDEYMATLTIPATGVFRYAFRFRVGSEEWRYSDFNGGDGFSVDQTGIVNVVGAE